MYMYIHVYIIYIYIYIHIFCFVLYFICFMFVVAHRAKSQEDEGPLERCKPDAESAATTPPKKKTKGVGWSCKLQRRVLQSSSCEDRAATTRGCTAPPDHPRVGVGCGRCGARGLKFPMGPGCAPASRLKPMGNTHTYIYICVYSRIVYFFSYCIICLLLV